MRSIVSAFILAAVCGSAQAHDLVRDPEASSLRQAAAAFRQAGFMSEAASKRAYYLELPECRKISSRALSTALDSGYWLAQAYLSLDEDRFVKSAMRSARRSVINAAQCLPKNYEYGEEVVIPYNLSGE